MKKRTSVSEEIWEEIKKEYISTNTSFRQLEQKYGVSFTQIQGRAKRGNWIEDREAFKSNRTEKSLDSICEQQVADITKAMKVADKLLDKISEAVEVVEPADTQSIKQLTGAIKDLKEIGIFRADMDRREQMARIAKLEKEAKEEQTDTTITVRFESTEEYAD